MDVGRAVGYLDLDTKGWESGFKTASQQMKAMGDSSQSMGNRFQAAGTLMKNVGAGMTKYVTLPIAAIGTAAAKMSMDTEQGMAKVNSILQLNKEAVGGAKSEWEMYSTTLKQGANDIGMGYATYSDAAYNAISAGVQQTEVVKFLDQANRLAKGGLTDLTTATDLLTTVQNSYNLSQSDMAKVSDILIQTQNKGKTTVDELGASMGKIIPTAKGLNVGVEQLGAGYALMTSKGIATAETTTYMNAMFNELGKSGTEVDKILKKVSGKSFAELQASGVSVADALDLLNQHAEKNNLSLSDLFGSSEAAKAAQVLLGDAVDETTGELIKGEKSAQSFNDMLKEMENSTGSTDKAFKEMNGTTKEQLTQSFELLKNALSDVGDAITPLVSGFASLLSSFAKWISNLAQEHPKLVQFIAIMAGVLAVVGPLLMLIGSLILAAPLLGAAFAFLTGPVGIVIAVITALIAIGTALALNWDTIKAKCSEVWESIKTFISESWENIKAKTSEIWEGLKATLSSTWDTIKQTAIDVWNSIGDFFTQTIPQWINNIGEWFAQLPELIGFALGFAIGKIVEWGTNTWNYLATNVPVWINNVSTFFSELPGKIWNWLSNAFQKVVTWGSNMLSKAISIASNFISNVITYISQLPGKLWTWLTNTIQKVIQWGTDMVNKGKQAASNTVNAIVNGFKSLPSKVMSIGKSVVEGIWNGISSMGSWISSKISGFCSGIVSGFKSALKINSPAKVMYPIGEGVVEGVEVGMENQMPSLERSLYAGVDELVRGVSDIDATGTINLDTNVSGSSGSGQSGQADGEGTGIILRIENFYNNTKDDIEQIMDEIAFVARRKDLV